MHIGQLVDSFKNVGIYTLLNVTHHSPILAQGELNTETITTIIIISIG